MRITLFISSLYGGGAERVTCNLASYLVNHGHDVEILTVSEITDSYELDEKVAVSSLLPISKKKNKFIDTLSRFPRLWSYLKKKENDLYIVMLPATTIMLLTFRWMTNAKVIAAERVDPAVYPSWIRKSLQYLAKKADGFVFQTEEARAWYGRAVKTCKTSVIPNAINPVFIREPYQGEKRRVISGAGRLNEQKNFSLLVRSFAEIANDFCDYNLVIYGEGEKRIELENLINELGLKDRVLLPGNTQNIADEMEKNTLFVLSSNYEGMPNALMEAMALGLPCISTDCPCGGPKFLIQNGVNGILVPVGNKDKLADAMRIVLEDCEYARKLGKKAQLIKETLEPKKIYGKWLSFIKEVVENNKNLNE